MLANNKKTAISRNVIIVLALIFLYLPIVTLITYSFNESRMVTVWTQTSLKWYCALFNNGDIIRAVGVSITIALMTACASVVIGTLAAFVLVRVGRFRGESLFVLLITAPMVLPEVITGLALLLIFVTLSSEISIFADRGIWAIWIAHVTFCSSYATVVIRSRFRELDISIEEAAMDLGAGPVKVFFAIILPALMPSEIAAFLLAFTMSMDDLVVASFIAGPDSTTLPMLIFSSVRRGLSPEINALATIIVFIVSIFTFFAWLSMVKKQKRKRADAAKAAKAAAIEEKLHYSAPHGEDALDERRKLDEATLAVLKEQALALSEGKDISNETRIKLQKLGTFKPESHSKILDESDYDEQTDEEMPSEEEIEANYEAIEAAKEAAKEAAEKAAAAAIAAEQLEKALEEAKEAAALAALNSKDKKSVLGDSAKDATAQQRIVSSTLAQAGMAKVVETSQELKHNAKDSVELDSNVLASSNATTSSSLADAKAKKAAQYNAISQTVEHLDDSSNSDSTISTSVMSSLGTMSSKAAQGTKSAKAQVNSAAIATTASSLAEAKAKKSAKAKQSKNTSDLSASQVTIRDEDKAQAQADDSLKVFDNTNAK